jgi:hypothetical protein
MADASLTNVPRNLQAEVVSPVLGYDDIEQLQEVVRAIRRAGARVDSTCGIHIHIDAAPFDGRRLGNLAKMVYKQEPLILHALGVSDARQRRYTRPVEDHLIRQIEASRPTTTDELNRLWYGYHNSNPHHYDSSRYYGEFRVMLSGGCGRAWEGSPATRSLNIAGWFLSSERVQEGHQIVRRAEGHEALVGVVAGGQRPFLHLQVGLDV